MNERQRKPEWKRIMEENHGGGGGDGPPPEDLNKLLKGRVLLGKRIVEGVPPTDFHEPDILIRGLTHLFFSMAGQGKSLLALALTARALKRGERVLYLDSENGWKIIAERLEGLGVDPETMDANLLYVPYPELSLGDTDSVVSYRQTLNEEEPDLVVFDSWLNFLGQSGLGENDPIDIEQWSQTFLKPARTRGITTLILDHVPHDADRPRGSGRKIDACDVMFKVRQSAEFDRDTVGQITLVRRKDRESVLPSSLTCAIGGNGTGKIIFRPDSRVIEEERPEDGLKPAEKKTLEVLRVEFGPSGATGREWRKKVEQDTGYHEQSFYRAARSLTKKGLIHKENERYYVTITGPPPKGGDDSGFDSENDSENAASGGATITRLSRGNDSGKPARESQKEEPLSQLSQDYHEPDDSGAEGVLSLSSPPYKGGRSDSSLASSEEKVESEGSEAPSTPDDLTLSALEAWRESEKVRSVVRAVSSGAFDKDPRAGASEYRGGGAGQIASALAVHHGEASPDAWKRWVAAAAEVLDHAQREGE